MAKKGENEIKKAAMIEALRSSLGVVMTAAKKVGIHRDSHYRWLKSDPNYAHEYNLIKEDALDFVESSLLKQIQGSNTAATIFYLKTQGKARGYVERQEVVVNQTQLSEEELIKEIERVQKRIKDAE